ncbi:MAG: hypothetical protein V7604_2724 [Hyphomicrobiales bacterium]|jgi:hypothetical protein
MCFGNQVQTEKKTTDTTLPSYLGDAAKANIANAAALTSQPFQAYTDPRVAARNDAQNTASGLLKAAAGTTNPYTGQIEGAYNNLTTAPAATIAAPSIIGPNTDVNTSTIQDYMNPYLEAALQPQLQAIARQGDADRKRLNAAATFSGAFGDARHGIEASNQSHDENILTNNTIGQGYSNAFNTAAGLRGTDITNAINTQNLTAQNREAALARAAAGGTDLLNLDKYNTGRQVDLANALEAQGSKEQANSQAQLDAQYQDFLRRQGYGPDMIKLFTSVLAGTPHDTSSTATTEQPDNSGYGILSALLGTAAKAAVA